MISMDVTVSIKKQFCESIHQGLETGTTMSWLKLLSCTARISLPGDLRKENWVKPLGAIVLHLYIYAMENCVATEKTVYFLFMAWGYVASNQNSYE